MTAGKLHTLGRPFTPQSAEIIGDRKMARGRGSRGAEMRQESEDFREAYEKLDEDLVTRHKRRKLPW